MDWPKARAILLVAFAVVNLVLGYSIYRPNSLPFGYFHISQKNQEESLRAALQERGLLLAPDLILPPTPGPMRFLHVEQRSTPAILPAASESIFGSISSGQPEGVGSTQDPVTHATLYRPGAMGLAAREIKLENRSQVQQAVEAYLRQVSLMPEGKLSVTRFHSTSATSLTIEYAPEFNGVPVFSGHMQVSVSIRGIESVSAYWVDPKAFANTPPKAVRPAAEALLRLAGRLEQINKGRQTVLDVRLGYYAGNALAASGPEMIKGWETVPVWRVVLESGDVFYINAFNGEWEA